MQTNDIRQSFIDFFADRGHQVRPGASLIPIDPTLLLVNAGMVPFKPYFLGEETPPFERAVSVQRVVRTIDIDIIGTTNRHLSFFEMLGNFSFGDYFKQQAISWAYEYVTEVLGLDPDRLWYTVYDDDEEAKAIWIDEVGVPDHRVQYGGKDNFWQMGVPGPCGPSSELFYDLGPDFGAEGGPIGGSESRYVEFWNLVFMQNIQDEPYHVVGDLPAKSIDTGMGLERIASILQGAPSVWETDTMTYIRDRASAYTGLRYGSSEPGDVSLRIMADHARSVVFLISDGVVPSNDGRGYVLRRLLRRAVLHGWRHGGTGLVFPGLAEAVIEAMGPGYPAIVEGRDYIADMVTREEERFRRTLAAGSALLEEVLEGETSRLSGATAFKLHDTYGFPIDLTTEIAAERGVEVDRSGFDVEMAAQRDRARRAWKGGETAAGESTYRDLVETSGITDFVGYTEESSSARILAMLAEGEPLDRAEKGMQVEMFLDRTPFYGESGGQVGDTGTIAGDSGSARVVDTQHALPGLHGHRATVVDGFLAVGQEVTATIDSPRREGIRKSHTGTHVLHWALRHVLGDHANQAGSHVSDGRIRFDFSHFSQPAPQELEDVEAEINRRLMANSEVTTQVTTKEQAQEMGALAFFGDKYGEVVRVVQVGNYSTEFCGGTHTHTSGQVGPLLLTSESSIGSNLRRVEALTGLAAYDYVVSARASLSTAGRLLRSPAEQVVERIESLLHRVSGLEARIEELEGAGRADLAAQLVGEATEVGEFKLVAAETPEGNAAGLRDLALTVRDRLGPHSVVILGSASGGKGMLVGLVSKDLAGGRLSAADLIKDAAATLGGGGSPDPELAQAGGPRGDLVGAAIELAAETAARELAAL